MEWPIGLGTHTTSSSVSSLTACADRTLQFVVCSVCITPFGVASVPDVKITSDRAAGSVTGSRWAARATEHVLPEVAVAPNDDVVIEGVDRLVQVATERGVVEAAVLVRREQQLRGRGAQDVVELTAAVVRQQRVEHRASRQHTEVDRDRLVPVGELDRHHLAGPHAVLTEERGDPARVRPQLAVADACVGGLVDDRDRLGLVERVLAHACRERRPVPPAFVDVALGECVADHHSGPKDQIGWSPVVSTATRSRNASRRSSWSTPTMRP